MIGHWYELLISDSDIVLVIVIVIVAIVITIVVLLLRHVSVCRPKVQ